MSCDYFVQECTDIDLSWHQRHLQMTPLFAATQASQSLALEQSVRGDGVGVALRATQRGLAFTPTQGRRLTSVYIYIYIYVLYHKCPRLMYLKVLY